MNLHLISQSLFRPALVLAFVVLHQQVEGGNRKKHEALPLQAEVLKLQGIEQLEKNGLSRQSLKIIQ